MYNEIKKNIPNILLLIGLFVYICVLLQKTFSHSILLLVFVLYSWIFISIYLKQLTFNKIRIVFCLTGIVLSITLFFLYGVERVPYPEGAIIFHINNITMSVVLFFLSTLPLIFVNKNDFLDKCHAFFSYETKKNLETKKIKKEEWEEATIEDINSGEFDVF